VADPLRDPASPVLLIVHHTPSPAMHSMLEAVRRGAADPQIEGVSVVVRAALEATATDVLGAHAYLLGSPVNLGYVSGALKHFFDTIYYPCLESTVGRPFGLYLHADNDATGALRAVGTITTGLRWRQAAEHLVVTGPVSRDALDACAELGATLAATLMTDAAS
jgi:NAD(P)H-dependent FMN reductase